MTAIIRSTKAHSASIPSFVNLKKGKIGSKAPVARQVYWPGCAQVVP